MDPKTTEDVVEQRSVDAPSEDAGRDGRLDAARIPTHRLYKMTAVDLLRLLGWLMDREDEMPVTLDEWCQWATTRPWLWSFPTNAAEAVAWLEVRAVDMDLIEQGRLVALGEGSVTDKQARLHLLWRERPEAYEDVFE